jgi:hypothetical protein
MADFGFRPAALGNLPRNDYSWLSNLPEDFWKGQAVGRENELRGWIQANPDAPIDEVARHLMAADPVRGAQLLQSINNQEALNNSRIAGQVPDDIKMLEWWKNNGGGGGQEPMRAGPAESSGVPGMSLQNAPALLQKKFMSIQDQEAATASGKLQGQTSGMQAAREALAPKIEAAIHGMSDSAKEFDAPSFDNALGPLQGSDPNDGIVTREIGRAARFGGEIMNWAEGGKTAPTEVRSKIMGDANALALAIKPMVRNPGEGIWSDKDQALLNSLMGDLPEARTQEEYQRRLGYVVDRLNSTFGLTITKPGAEENVPPPYDAAEPEPPAVQGSVGGPTETIVGGKRVLSGPGAAPPQPSTRDKNALIYATKNFSPEDKKTAMERFDKIYNYPGLAAEIVGESQAGR